MPPELTLDLVLVPSGDVVFYDLEDDTIVVPIGLGSGTADDFYLLQGTAQAIWALLDGRRTLGDVATVLGERFAAAPADLAADVLRFAADLVERRLLVVKG